MKKAIAEFIGTFALVLLGCGTAVIAGMGSGATSVDILGIATAFGLAIVAMAYGIGQVSGCHINPAVSFGVLVAGRMSMSDFITYVIAQVLGAIAGAVVLYLILSGKASGWSGSLGQNGWGPGYLGEYNTASAFIYEVAATFLFLVCILGVTQRGAPVELAGIAIGLTLIAIHLLGINVTGTSVNPARSLGPAIVGYAKNPHALEQVWLFIIAPLIGAGIAGYLFKARIIAAEDVIPERAAASRMLRLRRRHRARRNRFGQRGRSTFRLCPLPFRAALLVAASDAFELRQPRLAADGPQLVARREETGLVERSWIEIELVLASPC